MHRFDDLDMKLLYELTKDGSISVPTLSKKLGINRDPKLKEAIHKKFMETSEVVSISEVTGRFDIVIQVYAKNLEALHSVVIEKIGKIEGIQNTETFVELQKTDKDPVYLIE